MPDDRSLDEFASDPTEAADVEADDADGDAADGIDAESANAPDADPTDGDVAASNADAVDVDPAVPTATWTTDAAACDRCGGRVSRRWLDDGVLVCGECKEW
ncbi:DUF7573 domain-containing protein [Halorubrum sp. HHNYT27]|uniref:DUF7573 domain-containing protein n=1 Tax=Halorubrum sp. HHNYT27 TaxID=3402275 RepID=UPI003EBC95EE